MFEKTYFRARVALRLPPFRSWLYTMNMPDETWCHDAHTTATDTRDSGVGRSVLILSAFHLLLRPDFAQLHLTAPTRCCL